MSAPLVLNVGTPVTPLIFDQSSNSIISWPYDKVTDISAWGGRMALYVDPSAVLLTLSTTIGGGNGKLVLHAVLPNIAATILATDTAPGQPIASFQVGTWYLYLDPSGTPGADSFKAFGGNWFMNLLGPT